VNNLESRIEKLEQRTEDNNGELKEVRIFVLPGGGRRYTDEEEQEAIEAYISEHGRSTVITL